MTGGSGGTGNITNVEFGFTKDEIIVFSDFGLKATIWSLLTKRGVEVRDPKNPCRGHSFRPSSGHLAVLVRETMRDVVMVLSPVIQRLENIFSLATVDAQGLEWSPDGNWLVTWEAASAGFHVLVYTADGNLFKNYFGGQRPDTPGLGVRTVEWDHSGKHLAVKDYENQIHLLATRSVSFAYPSRFMILKVTSLTVSLFYYILALLIASMLPSGKSRLMHLETEAMLQPHSQHVRPGKSRLQATSPPLLV